MNSFTPSIYCEIFSYLQVSEFMPLACLCKTALKGAYQEMLWEGLSKSEWKTHSLGNFNNSWRLLYKFSKLFKAKRRSTPYTNSTCKVNWLEIAGSKVFSTSESGELILWQAAKDPFLVRTFNGPVARLQFNGEFLVVLDSGSVVTGNCKAVWRVTTRLLQHFKLCLKQPSSRLFMFQN
jgi:hypothetical protein